MAIGKGRTLKSLNEVEPGKHIWMNHVRGMDTELVLVKVLSKHKGGVMVLLPSGSRLEVTNPRAFTKAIGEP